MIASSVDILTSYRREVEGEIENILGFWVKHTLDKKGGGFIGSLDNDNLVDPTAAKGIVLNSRVCWAFSAGYARTGNAKYLEMASIACKYILERFIDPVHGGVYWSVDHAGKPMETRKQVYGLAFGIYGLTEYFKVSRDKNALEAALSLHELIERHSFDSEQGGYLEAFTRDWQIIDDMRLSEKDDNEKKTMNTHLHIIEAYANLYEVSPGEGLKDSIRHLLDVFMQHFIDPHTFHLRLFMDENWNTRSTLVSYGHDIEAAWLLLDCAEKINSAGYIQRYRGLSLQVSTAAAEGLDADGGLWYEYDPSREFLVREKHSWPQAEAMIGFFNAWQLTGNEKWLKHSMNAWNFVKQYIKDDDRGEWFWGVYADYSLMQKEKAGFWKCPYHNSRACLELMRRIDQIKN
jgi:mannobiose 2-epimerase